MRQIQIQIYKRTKFHPERMERGESTVSFNLVPFVCCFNNLYVSSFDRDAYDNVLVVYIFRARLVFCDGC